MNEKQEKYFGNYLGLVVRSDDPENRNRVKVFIPHISAAIYTKWNELPEDKVFNFLDAGDSKFGEVFDELRRVLPWAEAAAPLIGSVAAGRHNAQAPSQSASPFTGGGGTFGGKGAGSDFSENNTIADGNQTLPALDENAPALQGQRSSFADQLKDPVVKDALFTRTQIEVGNTDTVSQTAFMESVMNRAACRNMSLLDALNNSDGYYPHKDDSAFAAGGGRNMDPVMNNVLNGSNITNGATGNASGSVGFDGGPLLFTAPNGERFGLEGNKCGQEGGISEKPALAIEKTRPTDGFVDSQNNPNRRANAFGNEYAGRAYSNVAKGMFSTPNVGAHLWVFFQEGNPLKPVYFAAAFGASDYAGVRAASSDPQDPKINSIENPQGPNGKNDRYRGSTILNERGGTLELINTEGREALNLVNYHGNNLKMGEHMSMYSANNHQHLVAKDSFFTVNHDRNEVVRNHYDLVVYGDILRKTGHTNSYLNVYKKIYDVIKPTHDKIALYEKKRADPHLASLGRGSTQQSKSGTPAKCPVCTPGEEYSSLITTADTINLNGMSPSEAQLFEVAPTVTKGTSEVKKQTWGSGGTIFGKTCATCGGSGESPSSEQGEWQDDQQKQQAAQDMVNQIDQLAELEAQLGPGGSEIVTVAKDYTITCGLLLNDLAAVRTDTKGKLVAAGMKVNEQGVYREKQEVPIMEIVPQHPAFPGGNFDLTVMNRYNVMVGSGGIFFKTKGVVQMGGTITNLNGDQILITSANETKITAGKSFSIAADTVSLAASKSGQVIIDGGLAVARNMIVAGGIHIEGELSVHHVTAPLEYQLTELQSPGGLTLPEQIIGYVVDVMPGPLTLPIMGSAIPDTIVVDAHRHYFANLPLSLMETSDDVRSDSSGKNSPDIVSPKAKYSLGTATVPTTDPA